MLAAPFMLSLELVLEPHIRGMLVVVIGAMLGRDSSGGMDRMDGSMELYFFRALSFQVSEPEIWQKKSLFLRNFRDCPANFGL